MLPSGREENGRTSRLTTIVTSPNRQFSTGVLEPVLPITCNLSCARAPSHPRRNCEAIFYSCALAVDQFFLRACSGFRARYGCALHAAPPPPRQKLLRVSQGSVLESTINCFALLRLCTDVELAAHGGMSTAPAGHTEK